MSAGKAAEGVPGATTKKVVLVCPYASCLGFSGRSQRKPTLGDAGSVQASRGDVRSARSGEGGQGRMHGEAVTCHLSKEVLEISDYEQGLCFNVKTVKAALRKVLEQRGGGVRTL